MKILPLSLLCLCLPCGLSRGDQPPDGSPVRFQISMDQAAEHKAPEPDPVPDQSTPFNAAKLLLRALQEKTVSNAKKSQGLLRATLSRGLLQ